MSEILSANVQGEPRREPETNLGAAKPASAPPPCSPLIGTEDDPFGVGCKPEDFEDTNFLHGGIYRVASESDLQGVLELLRTSLESDQDSIVVHLSVYQGRNSCSRDLSDTESAIYRENVKEESVMVVDRKQLEDALEKKRRQDTNSGVKTEFDVHRQVTLSDLPGYEGQL